MSEPIQSISLAVGASITLPVVAFTGIVGRIRSPLPQPDARIVPDDGSIFTVAIVEDGVEITGVALGSGSITLIADTETTYPVIVEEVNNTRWQFSYASFGTAYNPPPPPLGMDTLVNDQRVQLTFYGTGADDPKDIDWGDGTVWSQRDDNPAQYDYSENGTYTIVVTAPNDTETVEVTIEHFPRVTYELNDPLLELHHNQGPISTTVDWGDGTTDSELAEDFSHMYSVNGDYTVTVTIGGFPPETFDVTIANAEVGGAAAPPPDTICYGPFDIPGLQQFWVCTAESDPRFFSVAIDIDADPGPDLQVFGKQLADALVDFDQAAVNAAIKQVIQVWKG